MMKFFSNGAWRPAVDTIEEIATPIGEPCLACEAPICAEDCGVSMVHMSERGNAYRPWHLACFRDALGIQKVEA